MVLCVKDRDSQRERQRYRDREMIFLCVRTIDGSMCEKERERDSERDRGVYN